MSSTFGKYAFIALAALTAAGGPAVGGARAAACPAGSFVTAAGNAFERAASAGSPEAFAAAAARFTDLRAIANFALGSYRSSLPAARQAEYFTLTRHFMGSFMAAHASKFRAGNLRVVDCSDGTISARTDSGERLVFRLEQGGGGYRIRDVRVQSIWLAQQLRSTFVGKIRDGDGDIEALFSYLKRY
jgi:ABC-type transporter MlaC component